MSPIQWSDGRPRLSAKKQAFAIFLAFLISLFVPAACAQAKDKQTSADDDPVLQAMRAELERITKSPGLSKNVFELASKALA